MAEPVRPTIFLRCEVCGNAVIAEREEYDHPRAVVRVTNECCICNAANGGFEESWYYDADGNELDVSGHLRATYAG